MDEGTPEVEVAIDRFKTSYYNVTVESVTNQIRSYLEGASAGTFEKDGELKDITIRLGEISLRQLSDLIITAGNVKVPLSELARISTITSPREITRRNQARTCYVYAMTRAGQPFDKIIREAESSLRSVALPVDYKMEFTGEELKRKESMSNLTFALVLSLVLVFMVLAAQFESIIQPFVIMLTIPLAGIGTVLTFLLMGKPLNMMAYIGIIMLAGIAVNSAIILVDRINQLRESGIGKRDAIILAGSQRIRPILMTSITTILALLPLTIGLGESASLRSPMALAVIGGLVSSTLLTLIVIPCVYWMFDSFADSSQGQEEESNGSCNYIIRKQMDFILNRRVLISMLFTGLTVLGFVSYKKLAVELLPNAEFPSLFVQVGSPLEVDPSYIETQAIIPIEGAIGTIEGVEKIESNITSRYGTISVYFIKNADLKYANLKLQEKIDIIKNSIPSEFIINVIKIDLEQLLNQFMSLQVRGEGGVDRIRNITDREIKPELENIDGIAGVQVYGGKENAIEVRLNKKACKSLGITMNQVSSLLNNNGREKAFAGKVYEGSNELYVNVTASYTDVRDIGNIIVRQDGPVLLRDIAEIFYGVREQSSISRVNGMDEVTVNLVNDRQANLIRLSHASLDQIEKLNRELASSGIEIIVQNNSAETMEKNINQIINLAVTGGFLAILILWFFLRNIRLVTVIAFQSRFRYIPHLISFMPSTSQ